MLLTQTGLQSTLPMGRRASEGRCQTLSRALKHGGLLWTQGFSTAGWRQLPTTRLFILLTGSWVFLVFILYFSWAMHVIHTNTLSLKSSVMRTAIVGVEFWAWKMPFSRKKGIAKAFPWGPCECWSSAAHTAEARGRAVVIYCYMSNGPQVLHHAIWVYSHQLSQGKRLSNNNLCV